MKSFLAAGLSGTTVTLLCANGAFAGMIDLGGGWRATWDASLDPYVQLEVTGVDAGTVFLRKYAEFTQPPPFPGFPFPTIPITFTQTSASAVNSIVIQQEVITNSTGRDWTDFHMEILNGHEAFFNPQSSGGFDVAPFQQIAFSDTNHVVDIWDGLVPNGTVWNPGSPQTGGGLWIDVLTGDGDTTPFTVFTLKETPTPTPASLALLGLSGGLASTYRRRR